MEEKNVVDVDAARVARREAKRDNVVVRFGGEEFALPPELSFAVVEYLSSMSDDDGAANARAVIGIVRAILGDEQYEKFTALNPSIDDFEALIDGVLPTYGLGEPGESSASES